MPKENESTEVLLSVLKLVERLEEKLNAKPKDDYLEGTKQMREAIAARVTDKVEMVPSISQFTGAKFNAKVCSKPGDTVGNVQDLQNYQYPEWALKHQADGGKVPNGLVIQLPNKQIVPPLGDHSGNPAEHVEEYLLWRWQNTYQRDLQLIIGNPLHASTRAA